MLRSHLLIILLTNCMILMIFECKAAILFAAEGSSSTLTYKPFYNFSFVSFLVERGNGYEVITSCNYSSKQCVSNTVDYAQFLIYDTSIQPYTTLEIRSVSRCMVNWIVRWTDIYSNEQSPVNFNITINGTVSSVFVKEGTSYTLTYMPYFKLAYAEFQVDRGNGYEGITQCHYSSEGCDEANGFAWTNGCRSSSKGCSSSNLGYIQNVNSDNPSQPYTTLEISSVNRRMTKWILKWTDVNGYEHLPVSFRITTVDDYTTQNPTLSVLNNDTTPVSTTSSGTDVLKSTKDDECTILLYLTIFFAVVAALFVILFAVVFVTYLRLRKMSKKINVYDIPENNQHEGQVNTESTASHEDLEEYVEIKQIDYLNYVNDQ